MLNIGDKIYYINYEESGSSYTIVGISEEKDNPVMTDGIYYTVHSDKLSDLMGYYPIKADCVDMSGSRYFSSAEKACVAYQKLLESKDMER